MELLGSGPSGRKRDLFGTGEAHSLRIRVTPWRRGYSFIHSRIISMFLYHGYTDIKCKNTAPVSWGFPCCWSQCCLRENVDIH